MQTKYTTEAKVRAKLGTTTLTADEINEVITAVSANINTYIGYKLATDFNTTAKDYYFDGTGTENVVLNQPVYSFLRVDYVPADSSSTELKNVVPYPLNSSYTAYLATRTGKFTAGNANHRLKDAKLGFFSVDWATPANHTLDTQVESACISLCLAMIKAGALIQASSSQEEEKSGKITGETIGSYSISYANNLSEFNSTISQVPTVSNVLNKYKSVNLV